MLVAVRQRCFAFRKSSNPAVLSSASHSAHTSQASAMCEGAMAARWTICEKVLRQAVEQHVPAFQAVVRHRGEVVWESVGGFVDPETKQRAADEATRFDIASLSKLFASTCFMRLVDEQLVQVDDRVSKFVPEISGLRQISAYENPLNISELIDVSDGRHEPVDASLTTFREIMSHSSGLPAWLPLFKQQTKEQAIELALHCNFAYQPKSKVIYSDIGLIILGISIERIMNCSLEQAVNEKVIRPLRLRRTRYFNLRSTSEADKRAEARENDEERDCAPTEFCNWRNKRMIAQVHDENAWRLNGVSAHAGLFSNASDICLFGESFLPHSKCKLLSDTSIREMTSLQASFEHSRRALGFALWSADPVFSGNPFSDAAFGHTGFTGTSVWIDPNRELVVALLTNDVYFGRKDRKIAALRVDFHKAVLHAIDGSI
jgi:CubicO group peptidase (beta-lactamase class C family)